LDDALSLLRFQIEWGADESLESDPVDRLRLLEAQPGALPRAVPVPVSLPGALQAGRSNGTPAGRAAAAASGAATLDELRAVLAGFDGCALRDTASNLVFAEGDPASTTLIIGEPPGREEDRTGHPFAGPEGQLLDQMLGSVGLSRTALLLTPLLPWRPPGGRPPSAGEIAICLPFLHRLIVLLKPHRMMLLGGTAARAMLPAGQSRRRITREWVEPSIPGMPGPLPTVVLPGLAELLRTPPLRREAWFGLRLLRRSIDGGQTKI
jgi:uracil-DNA glycosylase family 4